MTLLDAALEYIAEGLAVFPLQPGRKTPFPGFRWRELATTDEQTVRAWWTRWPDANVAVVCGAGGGVFAVLDLDVKDGKPGLVTAARLLGVDWRQRHRHVVTPSGGAHVYVVGPEAAIWGNRKLAKLGLDIQGEGAYVVAPPSVLDGTGEGDVAGSYVWAEGGSRAPELQALVVHQVDDELAARMQELLASVPRLGGGGAEVRGYSRAAPPPDWEDADLPPSITLPPRPMRFWSEGDASAFDSDSEAVMACCVALMAGPSKLTPEQCLKAIAGNEWCWFVATKPDRRPEGGASAAQWLWTYNVYKAIPVRIEDALADAATAAAPASPAHALKPVEPDQGAAGDGTIDWSLAGGQLPSWCAPSAAAPVLAPGGGGASTGESPAVIPAWEALMARVEGLAYGELGAAEELLAELTVMALEPHQEDWVLTHLADRTGANRSALRASLKRRKAQVAEELAEARRASDAASGLASQYVYVEALDKVSNLVEGTMVTPAAFANMHGNEARDALVQGGMLPRVGQTTYFPLNPYSEAFRASQAAQGPAAWALVLDETTGRHRLNLWRPPSTRPDFAALAALPREGDVREAVAPWFDHMRRMRLGEAEQRHLVAYLAHLVQRPEEKINHMLLLGGVSGGGKDLLLAPLYVALGPENIREVRGNELESDFDPDITRAKVMMVSELGTGRFKRERAEELYNHLKPYCAAPPDRLSLTLKGKGGQEVPNLVQVIAQTNYKNALAIDGTDRRVFLAWATGKKMTVGEARAMSTWLDQGGAALVAAWLYTLDVEAWAPGWDPKAPPPETDWREDVLESGLSAEAEELGKLVEQLREEGWAAMRLPVLTEKLTTVRALRGERKPLSRSRVSSLLGELGLAVVRANTAAQGRTKASYAVLDSTLVDMSPGQIRDWVEGREALDS